MKFIAIGLALFCVASVAQSGDGQPVKVTNVFAGIVGVYTRHSKAVFELLRVGKLAKTSPAA
jgi:hypothetical protein